jgi:L-lactate dehydrogenase complex protein LldG
MTARDAILARLRDAPAADIAAESAALLIAPERPVVAADALVDTFVAQLDRPSVAATLDRIAPLADLPAAVRTYLGDTALYLPPDPALTTLDWTGLSRVHECPVDGGGVVAIANAAVAETGTLVLDTAPTAPMLPNFLALHHIVVVPRDTLVAHLEDVPPPSTWPRARYWITGVSGTTDIEGHYVRGAHGPRFLHVILLG